MISPSILLETETFFALNKPAGWVINDSLTAHGNPTIQTWVEENLSSEVAKNSELRNGIVHRIDKETSGVLLVAKTADALTALQTQFSERLIQKTYMALVHGELSGGGTIDAPIGRMSKNRMRFGVTADGRPAQTAYKVISVEKGKEPYSLLELTPKTGRTHQLRVHLAHIKHPIVSDPLYVGRKTNRRDRAWCPRLFLHAASLTCVDPGTQKEVTISAPLPQDLEGALHSLRSGE